MEKYQENLKNAIRTLKIADHMLYVTYPLVNEKRLLLKIFDEIYKSIISCINAILNYETLYKRIRLYSNPRDNFNLFETKCAKNYEISNEQIKQIKKLIILNKQHQDSAMEFIKKEKVVILSDSLKTETLDLIKVKKHLLLAKEILLKTSMKVR